MCACVRMPVCGESERDVGMPSAACASLTVCVSPPPPRVCVCVCVCVWCAGTDKATGTENVIRVPYTKPPPHPPGSHPHTKHRSDSIGSIMQPGMSPVVPHGFVEQSTVSLAGYAKVGEQPGVE